MKRIIYDFNNPVNKGTEDAPVWEDNLILKNIPYSETNEEIAKVEAYNGKYTVTDAGQAEPEPTADDILNALLGVNRYA